MHVETFEPRLVFSVTLSGGVLNLVGNDSANKFLVYKGSSTTTIVEENNVKKTFATRSITNITADLKGGNDTLTISASTLKPSNVNGGSGKDTITGGAGTTRSTSDATSSAAKSPSATAWKTSKRR